MPPDTRLDDDLFFTICQANRGYRIERPDLVAKMREYQDNGVRLGWQILPAQRQVQIFAAGAEPRCRQAPATRADEAMLPGLALDFARIWEPEP